MPLFRYRTLIIILILYFFLASMYALATPPLEASDEYKHYPVVHFIENQWQLPILDPKAPGRWLQEGAQPPLYYSLMAIITSPVDTSNGKVTLDSIYHLNKYAFIGNPNQVDNKNLLLHDPRQEKFPWQGAILAIYLVRFASILLGIGSLILTWQLSQSWNERGETYLPILATALMAFNPMFLFVSAAVNNDSLAILLGHFGLLQLTRIVQKRELDAYHNNWRDWFWLGSLVGLGLLTKLSLGALLLPAFICFCYKLWHQPRLAYLFRSGFALATPILVISGWWLLRNYQLYGDLTGLSAFILVQGTRSAPIDWLGWQREFGTFYRSFWGLFGGVNVPAPEKFYWGYNWLVLVSLPGVLFLIAQMIAKRNLLQFIFLSWIAILAILLIRWNLISTAFQGRLLFPALGAIYIFITAGLLHWFNRKWQRRISWTLIIAAFISAFFIPWIVIQPAYAYPQPLTQVPDSFHFGPIRYQVEGKDSGISLIGVDVKPNQRVYPVGNPLEVTLYWQATNKINSDYLSSVHLIGRDGVSVGQVDRVPASGMIPTSRWQPGEIYRDRYAVYVNGDAAVPAKLQVRIALYNPVSKVDLTALGPDDQGIDPLLVGEAALNGFPVHHTPEHLLSIHFTSGIELVGFDSSPPLNLLVAGQVVNITLLWKRSGDLQFQSLPDYNVFLHIVDQEGNQQLGADGEPFNGQYPTNLWNRDEEVLDSHEFTLPATLPAGSYSIELGLYENVSNLRAQRVDGGDSISIPIQIR